MDLKLVLYNELKTMNVDVTLYVKKLKTMLFPYFMGLSKILGTILGTNIL